MADRVGVAVTGGCAVAARAIRLLIVELAGAAAIGLGPSRG
jgi:hypothetical protein